MAGNPLAIPSEKVFKASVPVFPRGDVVPTSKNSERKALGETGVLPNTTVDGRNHCARNETMLKTMVETIVTYMASEAMGEKPGAPTPKWYPWF